MNAPGPDSWPNERLLPPRVKMAAPHLALGGALAVSSGAADAAAGVPGSRRLPGPLPSSSVVIEMSAAQVLVRLPVVEDVEGGPRRDGRQAGLADLQLLEVGVDRGAGAAMTGG